MIIDSDKPDTAKNVASLLGISERQVRRLAEDQVIPALGNNQFMPLECNHAYIDFKSGKSKPVAIDDTGQVIDFDKERARKTKAEADRIEFQNKIDVGKYREISEVSAEMQDAARVTATVLNDLKLTIARLAPELPNRALDAIEKESKKALTAIIELNDNYKTIEAEVNPSVDIGA